MAYVGLALFAFLVIGGLFYIPQLILKNQFDQAQLIPGYGLNVTQWKKWRKRTVHYLEDDIIPLEPGSPILVRVETVRAERSTNHFVYIYFYHKGESEVLFQLGTRSHRVAVDAVNQLRDSLSTFAAYYEELRDQRIEKERERDAQAGLLSPEEICQRGVDYFLRNHFDWAKKEFTEALKYEKSPAARATLYRMLSHSHFCTFEMQASADCCLLGLQLQPGDRFLYANLADAYDGLGRHNDASAIRKNYPLAGQTRPRP